ncbi:hypothetical protein [Streptomyces canus]|uniref:hypothetical protein n=1 Tax=Streptomyces canus TaxID=58343 RepID=UPI003251B7B2
MHDDRVLGELTAHDVEQARSGLDAAGHTWDAGAARRSARAGRGPGEAAGERLAAAIRGGPPRPGEWIPDGPPDSPSTSSGRLPVECQDECPEGYEDVLDDLFEHRVKELLFIEFTPDDVNVIKVVLGEGGLPRQADAGSIDWRSLAPVLDPHPDIRRFQLAGGIGTLPQVSRGEFDAAVLHWLKAYIPPSYEHSLLLLTPRPGWVLLERAAAAVRGAYTLRAELGRGDAVAARGTTEDAVAEVLRTAPLLADHTLVLARSDRETGTVRTHNHVLFSAGSRLRRGETATAQVTVHAGAGVTEPLYLPVFAGTPARDGTGAQPLTVHRVAVGALDRATLTFVLRGPGEVDLTDPRSGTAPVPEPRATTVDIPALLTRLPRRMMRPPRLELFLTIELSGADRAETEERLAFARELVAALARHGTTGPGLRVGAVGHYDHVIRENSHTARPRLLEPPVPAGPASVLTAALAGWRHTGRTQDLASSLEDALDAVVPLATSPHGAGENVRRVLLIVARRPPGRPQQHDTVPTCPLGRDWQPALRQLRAAGVRVMTRADPVTEPQPSSRSAAAARRYADAAWAELSADGSYRPDTDSAADVAGALAPSWRLEGPPCRLAFATPLL